MLLSILGSISCAESGLQTSGDLALSMGCRCLQVSTQAEDTHLDSSLMGKPFAVDKLGPCPPPNNEQRLDTVKCVMDAEKNADPTLSEWPLSNLTAFLSALAVACSASLCSEICFARPQLLGSLSCHTASKQGLRAVKLSVACCMQRRSCSSCARYCMWRQHA